VHIWRGFLTNPVLKVAVPARFEWQNAIEWLASPITHLHNSLSIWRFWIVRMAAKHTECLDGAMAPLAPNEEARFHLRIVVVSRVRVRPLPTGPGH
jgi:hypothetical protein